MKVLSSRSPQKNGKPIDLLLPIKKNQKYSPTKPNLKQEYFEFDDTKCNIKVEDHDGMKPTYITETDNNEEELLKVQKRERRNLKFKHSIIGEKMRESQERDIKSLLYEAKSQLDFENSIHAVDSSLKIKKILFILKSYSLKFEQLDRVHSREYSKWASKYETTLYETDMMHAKEREKSSNIKSEVIHISDDDDMDIGINSDEDEAILLDQTDGENDTPSDDFCKTLPILFENCKHKIVLFQAQRKQKQFNFSTSTLENFVTGLVNQLMMKKQGRTMTLSLIDLIKQWNFYDNARISLRYKIVQLRQCFVYDGEVRTFIDQLLNAVSYLDL